MLTWNEIYEAAEDKGYGSDELTRKDNARYEVACFVENLLGIDIEKAECPEEEVDHYTDLYSILFDDDGKIIHTSVEDK